MVICVSFLVPQTVSYPMENNRASNEPEIPTTHFGSIEPATGWPSTTLPGQPTLLVLHPTPTDVIFGRSNACYEHFGNRNFRAIMGMHSQRYLALTRHSDKSNFVKEICSRMKHDGVRFLKSRYPNDDPTGGYIEVEDKRAWARISQSLRYAADRTPEAYGLEQVALSVGNASSLVGHRRNTAVSAVSTSSDFRSSVPLMGTSLETSDTFEPRNLTYSLDQNIMDYGSGGEEDDPYEPIPLAPSVNKNANTTQKGKNGTESPPLNASTSGLVASFLQTMPKPDRTTSINSAGLPLPPPYDDGQVSDVTVGKLDMSAAMSQSEEFIMQTAGAIATTSMERSSSNDDLQLLLQRLEEARRATDDHNDW